MNNRAVKSYIRRDSSGKIDIDATVGAFRGDVHSWVQEVIRIEEAYDYGEIIEKVFKVTKAKIVPTKTLIAFAMRDVACDSTMWRKHANVFEAYIANAVAEGKLNRKSGRNGGVSRVKRGTKAYIRLSSKR